MNVEKGFANHGIPAGRRELRPPAKLEQSNIVINVLSITAIVLSTLVYGLVIGIYKVVNRLFFQKPISVAGRVCFVTGSARGLGRELCLELARNGAILACADINETANLETVKLIHDLGGQAKSYTLNVTNKKEVEKTARLVEEELGPVYLVVNNAALVMPDPQDSEEFIRASYNINVLGYLWVAHAFLPFLKKRNAGHIIFMGSISSLLPIPELYIYGSTKAAIRSLSLSMDLQLRMSNSKVKITALHPAVMNSSADYADLVNIRVNLISMFEVVEAVMDTVRYGGPEGTVPLYYIIFLVILQILPIEATKFFFDTIHVQSVVPTSEEYRDLPFGQLIRECGGVTNTQ